MRRTAAIQNPDAIGYPQPSLCICHDTSSGCAWAVGPPPLTMSFIGLKLPIGFQVGFESEGQLS